MVLALAVHPFQLPDANRAVELELLPPLTPPLMPRVDLELRPREDDAPKPPTPPAETPRAEAPRLERAAPEAPLLPQADEVKPLPKTPPRQLLDMARPLQPEVEPPIEVERRAARAQRLQTRPVIPNLPPAPTEPVTVTRAAPALQQPVEIPRLQAPGRRALDASRAAPQLPQVSAPAAPAPAPAADAPIVTAPPSEAAPAPSAQVQVLTSDAVVQSPVEIRPRPAAPASPRLNTEAGAPQIPSLAGQAGGEPAPGGGAQAGGGGQPGRAGGAGQGGLVPYGGTLSGGLRGGLRTTLGCENPDTYKLTPEEREVCLQRFGQRARVGPDLGLNISAAKQAEYDRYEACRRATGGIAPSGSASEGTSIRGLGANPSLKDCGPSTR